MYKSESQRELVKKSLRMISYQMSVQYVVNKKCIVDCSWPELAPLQVSVSCPLSALFRDPSVESQHQLLSTSPRHRSQTVTTETLPQITFNLSS